jgi:hypothetical protein
MSSPAFLPKWMPSRALDEPGDADLVDHLGELAGADRPQSRQARAKLMMTGSTLANGLASPPHMTGEDAVLRAGLAARDRRIDEADALSCAELAQFARHLGRRRGVVDEDRAAAHAREGAVRTGRDLAQIVVIADAGEDDLLALCRLGRGLPEPAAILRHPLLRLGGGAVVDRDLVPLGLEMARHGVAHDAETEESDLRHLA